MTRDAIHVACATDVASVPHAGAMVRSLLAANQGDVHVHLIASDAKAAEAAEPMYGMAESRDGGLSVHTIPDGWFDGLADRPAVRRWGAIIVPELVSDIERLIHLDLDLIVLDSLRPLWRTRLSNHLVAATTTVFGPEEGERRCAPLGIDPAQHFDPGVMMLSLDRLRSEGSAHEVIELARERSPELSPEDAINAVLAPYRRPIEPRWNCTRDVLELEASERTFGRRATRKARRNPAIRHFAGRGEWGPWEPRADPDARDLYWRHRNETPWAAGRDLNHPWGQFFAGFRQSRRDHYASRRPSPDRRRAVQTIVHNEAVFLPIWLGYHRRFFAPEDIYVFDHETTDGSTDRDGFVRIPVSHDTVDHTWMVRTLEAHQHELLERYDVVLTLDVDELVCPDPGWGTLGDYLDRFDEEFVNCLGYEVLHLRNEEPAIDLGRSVLEQRRWWFPNDGYDKPALATEPTVWEPGFHARADGRENLDPDLRLIHLHRMDYETCLRRHRHRRTREWNEHDVKEGWASHNLIGQEEELERWFYEDSAFEDRGITINLEPVPPAWRGVF